MCLEYRTICTDSLPRAILTQNALLMILLRGRQSSSLLHPPISVILENCDPVYLELLQIFETSTDHVGEKISCVVFFQILSGGLTRALTLFRPLLPPSASLMITIPAGLEEYLLSSKLRSK